VGDDDGIAANDMDMDYRDAEVGRGIGGFAAGVVFGALLGAGIALMLAPDRGDKTRRRLRRRLERLREDAGEGLERRRRRAEAGLGRMVDRAKDIV
jgi:hypothetical protein